MTTISWARYDFVRSLLVRDLPRGARVVELGAAPGDQAAALAKAGFRVTAVDIGIASDEWAGADEGRMAALLADAGVTPVEWDLEATPYPFDDATFDAVVMTEVYEHLRDYPIRSLQEANRILRPGGRLYFSTPNAASLMNRLRLLRGQSVATPLPDWIGGLPHARHAGEYTVGEVDHLMRYAGLRVVSTYARHFSIGSGPPSNPRRAIDLIGRLRPSLGTIMVVVAERETA